MREIGAVLFDGFEMLDLYGPLELFSMFRDEFRIVTVAEHTGPVAASGGPATLAETCFDHRDNFDLLLVPGGAGTREQYKNIAMTDWIKRASARAKITMSVCTGSLLLGAAGTLIQRKATTNKLAFDWVVERAPDADWQRSARWVEDGDLFTASGVSAGMDMSLAVIERLLGPKAAQDAANWAEYIRNDNPADDPFAMTGVI